MVRTADTVESLNQELTALYADLRGVLSDVKDEASSQSAVGRMKEINRKLIDIQRRAVSEPTVSYTGLQTVLNDQSRLGAVVAVQKELDRLSFAKVATKELSDELSKFTGLLKNDGRVESEDGAVLVDARNEQERIERERVEINQRLIKAMLSANDAAGMDRLPALCAEGTRQLKTLAERRRQARGSAQDLDAARLRYSWALRRLRDSTYDHEIDLAKRGISSSAAAQQAGKEFAAADQELADAAPLGAGAGSTSTAPGVPEAPAPKGPTSEVRFVLWAGVYSAGWYQPLPNKAEDPEGYEKKSAEQAAKFPKWLAVVEQVRTRLRPLMSDKKYDRVTQDTADLRYAYSGSIEELAKRIDFAKVKSANETTRTIEIELDRKFPEVP